MRTTAKLLDTTVREIRHPVTGERVAVPVKRFGPPVVELEPVDRRNAQYLHGLTYACRGCQRHEVHTAGERCADCRRKVPGRKIRKRYLE